jgi:hypothetical protein
MRVMTMTMTMMMTMTMSEIADVARPVPVTTVPLMTITAKGYAKAALSVS